MTIHDKSEDRPNRHSIRLHGYDYTRAGYYFITICTQYQIHYFGEIVNATLCGRRNSPHAMIERWLLETEHKFNDVKIGPYVIMPNHLHFIIEKSNHHRGSNTQPPSESPTISPVGDIIRWFKTMTTNEYIRGVKQCIYDPFRKQLWQRNYYEQIIRNEQMYQSIADYIRHNPATWENDTLNTPPVGKYYDNSNNGRPHRGAPT